MGAEEYVEYHKGGKPGRRPVLKGSGKHATFDEIPPVDKTDMPSASLVLVRQWRLKWAEHILRLVFL